MSGEAVYLKRNEELVEVVRCKDCKNWLQVKDITTYPDGEPVYDCPYWAEEFGWAHEDGFCSMGEKKE